MAITVVSSAPCRCCHSACCSADGPPSVDVTILTVTDQFENAFVDSFIGRLFNLPRYDYAGRLGPAFRLVTYDYPGENDPPQDGDLRYKITVSVDCSVRPLGVIKPGTYTTKAAYNAAGEIQNVQFGYGWGLSVESEYYHVSVDPPWDSPTGWYSNGTSFAVYYIVTTAGGFQTYHTQAHAPCTEPLNIASLPAHGFYYLNNSPNPNWPLSMTAMITAAA